MKYESIVTRTPRKFGTSARRLGTSSALRSLAATTRLPKSTILLTGSITYIALFLISPNYCTNVVAVLLPLRSTIHALDAGDGEGAVYRRRKWWDYWFLLCTAFFAELVGFDGLFKGYWPCKLFAVLWFVTSDNQASSMDSHLDDLHTSSEAAATCSSDSRELARSPDGKETTQAMAKVNAPLRAHFTAETEPLSRETPHVIASSQSPRSTSPSSSGRSAQISRASMAPPSPMIIASFPTSPTSQYSDSESSGSDTSSDLKNQSGGIITTLDYLLELDFVGQDDFGPDTPTSTHSEDISPRPAESGRPTSLMVNRQASFPNIRATKSPPTMIRPNRTAIGKATTLDDLLELDFETD